MQTQNGVCLFNVTKVAHGKQVSLLQARLVHVLKEEEKPELSQRFLQESSFPCAQIKYSQSYPCQPQGKALASSRSTPRSFLGEKCGKVSLRACGHLSSDFFTLTKASETQAKIKPLTNRLNLSSPSPGRPATQVKLMCFALSLPELLQPKHRRDLREVIWDGSAVAPEGGYSGEHQHELQLEGTAMGKPGHPTVTDLTNKQISFMFYC